MSSNEKARLTLFVALLLLTLSGIGASVAIIRLYLSEGWVRHTYTVEVALGDLESALAGVGTSRVAYIDSPSSESWQKFRDAIQKVPVVIARIRSLTSDSPNSGGLCDRLQENADRRIALSVQSVELVQRNQSGPTQQMQLTAEVGETAVATATIEHEMRGNEDNLLAQRSHITKLLFGITAGILIVSFTLSAVMFWIHNRMLQRELHEREAAEQQLRKLSIQLLRVRDDESRRFARELHDGLGQTMVAAKMMAESLASQNPSNPKFEELAKLVQEAAAQTRTISYLLHPPMLDELGFASAAEWFIEGFTQRTGVAVAKHISPGVEHLPKDLELALFRILQESLTNIHRHSKSAKAEVSVSVMSQEITLIVSDYGGGIPPETLENFLTKGTHVGVGLAGMKERVTEFKGDLEIRSDRAGTKIIVKMPVTSRPEIAIPSPA
ncbi:MAG: ATP-binding protein [Candidatus Acidiferrales bacterium]|jgi:signal transduction histidine kinase